MLFQKTDTPFSHYPESFPEPEIAISSCIQVAGVMLKHLFEEDPIIKDKVSLQKCTDVIGEVYYDMVNTLMSDVVDDGTSYEDCIMEIADIIANAVYDAIAGAEDEPGV